MRLTSVPQGELLQHLRIEILVLLRHLRQPAWGRHTSLVMDGRQQRRQTLEEIPNRSSRIHGTISTLRASVPHVDLRLQPVDRLRVGLGQLLVCAVAQHHPLHEALRATKDGGHLAVRLGHGGETLSFALLRDEVYVGLALAAEVLGFCFALLDKEVGFGHTLFGLEVGIGVLQATVGGGLGFGLLGELLAFSGALLGVELCVGVLLRGFLLDAGLYDFGGLSLR